MLKKSPVAFSMPEKRISQEVCIQSCNKRRATLHERRTKRTACLSPLPVLPFCSPALCAANGRVISNLSFFNDSPLAQARLLLLVLLMIAGEAQSDAEGSTALCHCHPPDAVVPALPPLNQPDISFLFRILLQQTSIVIDCPWPVTPPLSDPQGFWRNHITRSTAPKHPCWLA